MSVGKRALRSLAQKASYMYCVLNVAVSCVRLALQVRHSVQRPLGRPAYGPGLQWHVGPPKAFWL